MRCPFKFKRPNRNRKYSFGVAGDFIDFIEEGDDRAEAAYYKANPTCRDRFWYWVNENELNKMRTWVLFGVLIVIVVLYGFFAYYVNSLLPS